MDIDDILAEISGPTIPQESLDLQALTRLWVAERVAPEILPWPEELMTRMLTRLRQQVLSLLSLKFERSKNHFFTTRPATMLEMFNIKPTSNSPPLPQEIIAAYLLHTLLRAYG